MLSFRMHHICTLLSIPGACFPGRIQQIDGVLQALKGGDLKVRVRALEVERAARRASILQVGGAATLPQFRMCMCRCSSFKCSF